ncbi:MAG: inverse autotransporter beta domain-containing protein, partial [Pseudomonadota bacterium]
MRSSSIAMVTLLALVSTFSSAQQEQRIQSDHYGTYVQIHSGERSGYSNGNQTEAMFFVPIYQNQGSSILFIDLRSVLSESDLSQNVSLGMGYRKIVNDKFILGANAAVDRRQSSSGETYTQGQIGVEVLMNRLEISANFYKPLSSSENELFYAEGYSARLDGNRAFIDGTTFGTYEQALEGYDLHVSYDLATLGNTDFMVDGSYYNFDGDGYDGQDIEGFTVGGRIETSRRVRGYNFDWSASLGARFENDQDPDLYAGVFGRFWLQKHPSPDRRGHGPTGTHHLREKLF